MNNNQPNMQQVGGSGLTRYRSAPSSYFASFLDPPTDGGFGGDDFEKLFNPRASSPKTQKIFSRFMNTGVSDTIQENSPLQSQPLIDSQFLIPPRNNLPPLIPMVPKPVQNQLQRQQSNDLSSVPVSQMMYHDSDVNPSSAMENSFSMVSGSNRLSQIKMESAGGSGGSGLIRHSSSPAGLFANLDVEKEFGPIRNMGTYGTGNSSTAGMSLSSASRFSNTQMDFVAKQDQNDFVFPMTSWDDSTVLSDNFLVDNKTFANGDAQNNVKGDQNQPPTRLAHHSSMPTSSADFSAMDKLFDDSVPCKLRAKRGCATHPRSIAERVRRTKISERMRKLQELVPNMDKQTNTSDMLDLSVEYIKDLQKELKKLTDNRAKCSCSAKSIS